MPITKTSSEPISTGPLSDTAVRSDADAQTIVVPVIREDWQLHKELRETGKVRVQRVVHDREELIDDSLTSDTVDIERIPMNQIVDTPPEVRTENGVMVIPVVKEFAVVTKQLRVIEEIRISRRKAEIPLHQTVSLRSEEVTVQRLPGGETSPASDLPAETVEFRETIEQAVITKQARVVEEVSITKEVDERTQTISDTVRHTEIEVEKLGLEDAVKTSTATGQ